MITTAYTAPAAPVVENNTYQQYNNDDLNARIQAVLAMSRDTIAKYGVTSSNANEPKKLLPSEAKASTIETRTYLNQNTNNIETTNYTLPIKTTTVTNLFSLQSLYLHTLPGREE